MITVAIKKYQTSILGKGTVKVKGKKMTTSKTEVIPINDKGFLLDLIMALQIAWHSAEKIIKRKIKLIDKRLSYLIPVNVIHSINCFWAIIKVIIRPINIKNSTSFISTFKLFNTCLDLNDFEIFLSDIVPT